MRQVGIYRSSFPLASESFLVEQASALRRYSPLVLTRRRAGESQLPIQALADAEFGWAREKLFAATQYARLFGKRQSLSNVSIVHAHFGTDGVYGEALARFLRVPLIVTFHGFDATMSRRALLATRKAYAVRFVLNEARLQRRAVQFLAISRFIAGRLVARGYPQDKITQHYIGVDVARFTPGTPGPDRYILCVARAVRKKGLASLIAAFARIAARHPDVKLVHVGGGPLLPALQQQCRELAIADRVVFRGALPHADVLALMRAAEVFAMTSCTAEDGDSEGLGIVLNEASACAVPIVATRHGGIPEAVLHGETGLLADEHDAAAIGQHLDALLADRGLARQLGLRGRELVSDVFNLARQTAKLEEVYDRYTR